MDPTKTLKRLGSIGLTTAVIAGVSPFLGAVAAHAASITPNPAGAVHLVDPQNGDKVSTQNDGTDVLVHLYADVLQSANNGGNPLITSVTFSYIDTGPGGAGPNGAQTTIATSSVTPKPAGADAQGYDSFAVATWTPPTQGDSYQIIAVGNEANSPSTVSADNAAPTAAGNCNVPTDQQGLPEPPASPVYTTACSTTTVAYDNTLKAVYVSRPHDNSLFGYYPNGRNGANFNVSGTSTSNGNTNLVKVGDGAANTTVTYDGTSNKWAADIAPNAADVPTTAKNKSVQAIWAEDTTAGTYERDAGEAYVQTFAAQPNGFTVTPTTQFGTANGPPKQFVFQTTDQHGNPIGDMPLYLTVTPSSSTPTDTVKVCTENATNNGTDCVALASNKGTTDQVTDPFGRLVVQVSDSANESVQLNVKTSYNGYQATQPSPGPATPGYNSAVDYSVTGTFTTAPQNATSGTATIVTNTGNPNTTLFADQVYGQGTAKAGPTPGVLVNLKDANNQPAPGQTVNYQYTRTIDPTTQKNCAGDTTTVYPKTVGPKSSATNADGTSDANGNLYITPDPLPACTNQPGSASIEAGSDAFTVYLDKNGVPGYQSGADTLIGQVTLNFGPEKIFFLPCNQISQYDGGPQQTCDAQQKAGTDKTLTIFASIFDGTTNQPITSRKIDITLSGGTGTAGTDFGFSANNNSGLTKVNATAGDITTDANGNASVTVFDNKTETLTVTASDPTLNAIASENATDAVAFRNYQAVLNGSTLNDSTEITPLGTSGQNLNGGPAVTVGAPGQPLAQGFFFTDQNGAPLRNEKFTVTTNKGFFTDLPTDGSNNYTKLHFDTPITDGQPIKGDLHSDGTSQTIVTDNSGVAHFALGILTDPHFTIDGTATGTVTAELNGAGSSSTLDNNAVLFSTDASTYSVAALNAGTMKLLEGYVDNTGVQHLLADKPSGQRATATKNSIPTDEVDTVAEQTDSFGNRVSEAITATSTGVGQNGTDSGALFGAYNNIDGATDDSVLEKRTVNESTNPASSSPQTGSQTVTFNWNANKSTGLTNTTTNATGVNVTNQTVTQSYTVTWYVRDPSKFKYFHKFTPGNNEPAGTPISETVAVFDNANRPVQGLGLEFIRSGPNGQTQDTGNPQTCTGANNGCSNLIKTDQNGTGGFTFISNAVGKYTITTIVSDFQGNEIGRDHASGELTAGTAGHHRSTTITTATGTFSFLKGSTHALIGAADPGAKVKIYRGGHHVGTTHANANGVWTFTLKFSNTHHYYARSHGDKSNTIKVKVHSRHHHKKHHKKH